jgi:hypothetical protein
MANEPRGEIDVVLNGETFTLRPTFEALCQIEAALGRGAIEIVERMEQHRFGVRDAATIIAATANAAGHRVSEAEIGAKLMHEPLARVCIELLAFLIAAISGGTEKNRQSPSEGPGG